MKLIKMKCPNCGANLKVDISKKKAFCQYCGAELPIDDEANNIHIDNAEKLGYDFEKGRQKANRENNKKKSVWIIVMAIAIAIAVIAIIFMSNDNEGNTISTGTSGSYASNVQTDNNGSADINVVIGNANRSEAYDASDFEVTDLGECIVHEHTYKFFKVKSNANGDALIDGNATAYNSKGNAIDTAYLDKAIIKNGETALVSFYFGSTDVSHVDYSLSYTIPKVSNSVITEVEKATDVTVNDYNMIFTSKNNTDYPLNVKQVKVLFYHNNKIEDYEYGYLGTSQDTQPGESMSGKITCPEKGCKYYQDNGKIEIFYEILRPIHY